MRQSSSLLNVMNKSVLFLSFTVVAVSPVGQNARHNHYTAQTVKRIPLNQEAKAYVAGYIRENRDELRLAKCRSVATFRMINKVFTLYGLPVEMKYLAVIESQLKSGATSAVGAKGLWQLMPTTAQQLGLKVDSGVDERVMNYKSTVAAAKYLKDLYGEFGDWLLVLAAYNGGPGPVYRAMKRSHSRDFWALQYFLPAESRLHVKRFIASHYYFEGKGSVTTLTKAEWIAYTDNRSRRLDAKPTDTKIQYAVASVVKSSGSDASVKHISAIQARNILYQLATGLPASPALTPLHACLGRRSQFKGRTSPFFKGEEQIDVHLL